MHFGKEVEKRVGEVFLSHGYKASEISGHHIDFMSGKYYFRIVYNPYEYTSEWAIAKVGGEMIFLGDEEIRQVVGYIKPLRAAPVEAFLSDLEAFLSGDGAFLLNNALQVFTPLMKFQDKEKQCVYTRDNGHIYFE